MLIGGCLAAKATVRPVTEGTPAALVIRPARANDVSKLSVFFSEAWKEGGTWRPRVRRGKRRSHRGDSLRGFPEEKTCHPHYPNDGCGGGTKDHRLLQHEKGRSEGGGALGNSSAGKRDWQGVGSRLLRKALDVARKRGFNSVLVKTEVTNDKAINFYRKAGFTESGKSGKGRRRQGGTSVHGKRLR